MASKTNRRKRSLPKGLLAGLIGGIAGAAVLLVAEEIFPPRQPEVSMRLADLLGHEKDTPSAATPPAQKPLHWALGAAAGGLYGMAVEAEPSLAAWRGAAFGLTLNRITRESRLPRMGQATARNASSKEMPRAGKAQTDDIQPRISAWISHAAYGIATDSVRRIARRLL